MSKLTKKFKKKMNNFIEKVLKNEKDANLNAHIKDEIKFKQMYNRMKMY